VVLAYPNKSSRQTSNPATSKPKKYQLTAHWVFFKDKPAKIPDHEPSTKATRS